MDRGAWWATSWGHRESDTTERLTYTHGDKSGKNGEIKKKKDNRENPGVDYGCVRKGSKATGPFLTNISHLVSIT